jgi:ABC-type transport system involved in multi-copper enzyme maturation permease subunit
VITIAILTLREAARRRILAVLLLLTLATVALTGWGVERLTTLAREGGVNELQIRIGVSQVLILVAFMFSFVLAMTAAFMGSPAIAGDIESGVAQSILARPIRRIDLLLGRWLGLSIVVAGYAASAGLLEIAIVGAVSGHVPPEPFLAVVFLAGQSIIVLTFAMLLSTRLPSIAGGAICVVLFGLAWMAGVLVGVAQAFDAGALASVARASRWLFPTDGLWRGVIYGLEPPLVLLGARAAAGARADANPFYAATPPPLEFVVWSVIWIAIVLGIAAWSLNRREI